ncbi:hypothetical protein ABDJ41_06505 [Pedobacter sp. ASV1-7]|uniref:hypothetical protein n=1 Tax=Pedobacter sp. ASV1-7 TaxID=3145237 RepID=UPI0032E893B5
MRYLAFIFTIYIMALSAWPCCGDENSISSNHEDVCLSSTEHQKDNHEHPDACSPFFHASNYHVFVTSPAITNTPAIANAEQISDYPEYKDAAVILFPGDIWQPPQLV